MKKIFNIIKTTLVWLIILYEGIKFLNLFRRYKPVAVATERPSDKVADTATQCNKRGGEDDVESK